MRSTVVFLFALAVAGTLAAQDTNFSEGPQYLITTSETRFLRPITTPSMSLQPLPADSTLVAQASAQEQSPPPGGPRNDLYLPTVYWGDTWVQHVTGENPNPVAGEIEITSPQSTPALPPSIMESGVTRIANAESLHISGYGLSLGEVSSLWKTRRRAPRVYTNADIARLHRS